MLSRVKRFFQATPIRKASKQAYARLHIDVLEGRVVPATASGVVTGSAFIDANSNGVFDASELTIPGASITLTGTTTQSVAVNVTAVTDANGAFRFDNVLPGNYQVQAGPIGTLLSGSATLGVISAPEGVVINAGETETANLGVEGKVAPAGVSLHMFFNTAANFGSLLGTPGSGVALANYRPNNTPTISSAIAPLSVVLGVNGTAPNNTINLAGKFTDQDYTNSQVTFKITFGGEDFDLTVNLFDAQTPQTVANFFSYVTSDKYDQSVFHRLVENFVLQGGGIKPNTANSPLTLDAISTGGFTVPSEVSISNTRGTIAMALSGDPPQVNSGTSQFFFNLVDNLSLNPNFTVFGRIADSSLAALLELGQADTENHGGVSTNIPVGETGVPAADRTLDTYMVINDITINKRDEFLTYTAVSSNESLVVASFPSDHPDQLVLSYPSGLGGTATITVTATDRFGASVTTSFDVTVTGAA
jgi:cyclophilin family peptidyl-prolyl cis-trans isomerase